MGVGEVLGILGSTPPLFFSFLGSISLLTQERIFSLSSLLRGIKGCWSCDYHVTDCLASISWSLLAHNS